MPDFSADAKKIADLAKQAMVTLDPAKQQQICYEVQRLMNQVGPFAWPFEANIQVGYRKDVIKRWRPILFAISMSAASSWCSALPTPRLRKQTQVIPLPTPRCRHSCLRRHEDRGFGTFAALP